MTLSNRPVKTTADMFLIPRILCYLLHSNTQFCNLYFFSKNWEHASLTVWGGVVSIYPFYNRPCTCEMSGWRIVFCAGSCIRFGVCPLRGATERRSSYLCWSTPAPASSLWCGCSNDEAATSGRQRRGDAWRLEHVAVSTACLRHPNHQVPYRFNFGRHWQWRQLYFIRHWGREGGSHPFLFLELDSWWLPRYRYLPKTLTNFGGRDMNNFIHRIWYLRCSRTCALEQSIGTKKNATIHHF